MKRKLISALLCAAMVGTMLIGCGGGGDSKSSDGGSDGGNKLVYWAMWSEEEPQAKIIQEAVEKYTADTGVEVDVQFKGRTGQREGIEAALGAKQNIDIFDESADRVNRAWGAYPMDIEEMAKDYEAEHGNELLFKICRETAGGTLKSIPYQPYIYGFFYNKALFKEAGIDAAPKTWEELDAACAKLKEAGITPITGDTAYQNNAFGHHMARFVGQDGVKTLVNDPAVAEKVESGEIEDITWDDPKVAEAVKAIEDFASKGYYSENMSANVYPAGQNQEFAPGEAAMIWCGSWLPNELKNAVAEDFEWGFFCYPSVPGGVDDETANNVGAQVLAINKDSKMAKEAFELITYITAGEFDKKMTEEAMCIPTDKANGDAWPAELAGAKEGFDSTVTFYDEAVGAETNVDLTPVLNESVCKLMAGTMTADEFISACKAASGE